MKILAFVILLLTVTGPHVATAEPDHRDRIEIIEARKAEILKALRERVMARTDEDRKRFNPRGFPLTYGNDACRMNVMIKWFGYGSASEFDFQRVKLYGLYCNLDPGRSTASFPHG
jgi:hypothetical protein